MQTVEGTMETPERTTETMGDFRRLLHENMEVISSDLVHLAALVGESVVRGTEALLSGEPALAKEVIDNDDRLDALSLRVEESCFRLLALQGPMASDLRTIVATMRINAELERSGDLMVNVAKGARRISTVEIPPVVRGIVQQMADEATRMLRFAMDSYVDRSGPLGAALHDLDDRLDDLQSEFVAAIFEADERGELPISGAVQLALIARYYERIGDHAVNIGERVQFMAEGVMAGHAHEAALAELERAQPERLGQ
ncbi:MAG: phosphate signaling complex protein PhoU [Acidimicrobiia bacterium]|nr:phosphate signaling complex protein PhoU [Acidimicrobiia bacterium]